MNSIWEEARYRSIAIETSISMQALLHYMLLTLTLVIFSLGRSREQYTGSKIAAPPKEKGFDGHARGRAFS